MTSTKVSKYTAGFHPQSVKVLEFRFAVLPEGQPAIRAATVVAVCLEPLHWTEEGQSGHLGRHAAVRAFLYVETGSSTL